MIEGQDWQNLDRLQSAQTAQSMFVKPTVMIDPKPENMQKLDSDVQGFFDKEKQRIERAHRSADSGEAKKEAVYADAFKKIFAERRKNN
ncbi:hypothetical protein [Loigolactobacillus coryniformis]|uniref:hypothetical protein n=1 Tax=Loigolactobacillus coryniformis TaxID=1610 RepID=UPI00031918F0|nr:hypothetical protein [Loigolactobacillus coryniformis]